MNRNIAENVDAGGTPVASHGIPTDPLLTDREASGLLACGRSTLWRWANDGVVPRPIKIGGMSRWRQSDIEAVIAQAAENREAA